MDIESIAKWVSIISGIVGIFGIIGIIFGKSLNELIRDWRKKRKEKAEFANYANPSVETPQIVLSGGQSEEAQLTDPVVISFRDLVKNGDYAKAIEKAERERCKLNPDASLFNPDKDLTLDDFDIWHARALIYTGKTEDGLTKLSNIIQKLEEHPEPYEQSFITWRKNMILGRAHNDKGYAHWMDQGHCWIAVQEFTSAIRYFAHSQRFISANRQEGDDLLATACDNIGRVYAQLGHRSRSELLIEHGRKIRAEIERNDRYALSLNSSAISYLAFGDPYHALELSKESLRWFKESKRGEGLAKITKGQAQRHIGAFWIYKRPGDRTIYAGYLEDSLKTLEEARDIFENEVSEPIRLCQVYNEIGCAHRELAQLQGDPEVASKSREFLSKGIEIAKSKEYFVLYVDGCEDLAQLYKCSGDIKNALRWLDSAEKVIKDTSQSYFFDRNKNIQEVDPYQCVEDFWQQLGKIYALRGHIAFDSENQAGLLTGRKFKKAIYKPIEKYVLAAGYFGRFLEVADKSSLDTHEKNQRISARSTLMNHRAFGEQLYSRLSGLNNVNNG
jgi:tetratricopeptide (TPR) repeat protein